MPPELTALLHARLEAFGTGPGGLLFRGERTPGQIPKLTIVRTWERARDAAFSDELAASPLSQSPCDLRHTVVSTWLNGEVGSNTVARLAGYSVEVLHKIYAKCLDGSDDVARRRVEAALRPGGAAVRVVRRNGRSGRISSAWVRIGYRVMQQPSSPAVLAPKTSARIQRDPR